MDFKKHCKVVSISYMEANYNPTITTNKNIRTHKSINLLPTGNLQGI